MVLFLTIQIVNKVKWFKVLPSIAKNSMKHQSFVYTQLNDQKVLFQTIQFSISHLFVLSLNVKPVDVFYSPSQMGKLTLEKSLLY